MAVDLLRRTHAELGKHLLDFDRQVERGIKVDRVIFLGGHIARRPPAGIPEPSGMTVKGRNVVAVRSMHCGNSLVRGLGQHFHRKLPPAEADRPLLHAAGNLLQCLGAARGLNVLIDDLICRRQRRGSASAFGASGRFGSSWAMMGTPTGSCAPRWQEKHVTSRSPLKLSRLMAICISIILRAVCLDFLSSFSNAFCTWQNSHSTPSELLMNCMAGRNWSAGVPFNT